MRHRLKNWLVPNAANGHYPRFWRRATLSAVVGLALVAGLARLAVPVLFDRDGFLAAILPGVIVSLTNQERLAQAAPALAQNELLAEAARLKAENMTSRSYFAHVTSEGCQP